MGNSNVHDHPRQGPMDEFDHEAKAVEGNPPMTKDEQITALREALAWYADQVSGVSNPRQPTLNRDAAVELLADGGRRARQSLAATEPEADDDA